LKKPVQIGIYGLASMVIIGLFLFSWNINEPILNSETNQISNYVESKIKPYNFVVIPTESKIDISESVVTPEVYQVDPLTHKQETKNDFTLHFLKSASAIPSNTLTVTMDEWDIPSNVGGRGIAIGPSGLIYFSEAQNIGRLDPSTNTIKEWSLSLESSPSDIDIDTSENVFFAGGPITVPIVGRLDPSSDSVTEWPLPVISKGAPRDTGVDSLDNVYYTYSTGASLDIKIIGRLDPSSNTITEWTTTLCALCGISGIAIDSSDNVYFSVFNDNKIIRLIPSTNTITEWVIADSGPNKIAIDSSDNVYFTSAFKLFRLVPATNTITQWGLSPLSGATGIAIDSADIVYFVEQSSNQIGRLDPSTNLITEWNIPTVGSFPQRVAVDSSDNVYFTESAGKKIGRIS